MAFDLTEERVQETEALLDATLPAAYRAAMMKNNGGSVDVEEDDWALCPLRDRTDRKRLARTANDVVSETRASCMQRGFPDDAIVIAQNGSGDCMVFRRDVQGFDPAPYIWWHETGEITRVADDFGALVLSR